MADPEAVAAKAGIATESGDDRSVIPVPPPDTEEGGELMLLVKGEQRKAKETSPIRCTICYESTTAFAALACGHPFCSDCYRSFMEHKVADEGHACIFSRCPEPKCKLVVTPQLVQSLQLNPDKYRQYLNAASLSRSYVDDQPSLKCCPAPDCGNAVQAIKPAERGGVRGVACSCGHRFCFTCLDDDHSPASCADMQQWTTKCRDDSETYNWLMANTKACPKCQTAIEKNGGCNHMTCKSVSCKHEFCWVCEGPWSEHSGSYYNCNKYQGDKEKKDGKESTKADTSRAALERYLFYYTRFSNHDNSLKLEKDAKDKMEDKISEMEKHGDNTYLDCLYLKDANLALFECRYALKFTYVFAFYLPREANFRLQFENQQTELERQTEELAGMLERPVADIDRREVLHCYKMAEHRLSNLMELVSEQGGYEEGSSSSDAAGSSSVEDSK